MLRIEGFQELGNHSFLQDVLQEFATITKLYTNTFTNYLHVANELWDSQIPVPFLLHFAVISVYVLAEFPTNQLPDITLIHVFYSN
jgi:hypothetical protein